MTTESDRTPVIQGQCANCQFRIDEIIYFCSRTVESHACDLGRVDFPRTTHCPEYLPLSVVEA